MPEMDGFQATLKLRAEPRLAALPIIALTAHALAEERQRCLDIGMNDLIVKPIDPDLLFSILAQWHRNLGEAGAGRPEGGDSVSVPDIPGMDVAAGLRRVGGNVSLYTSLLRQFCRQQMDAAEKIETALASGALDEARLHAHTVRGVAANLGAMELAEAATALETALAAEGRDTAPVLARFSTLLAQTLAAFHGWLDRVQNEAEAMGSNGTSSVSLLDRGELEKLVWLLEEGDGSAVDCFATLRPALASHMARADLEELSDAVESYNYAAALERLRSQAWPSP
jgi:two-component system sensor histidine kinase/response regulator